jgi:hypothetical protein
MLQAEVLAFEKPTELQPGAQVAVEIDAEHRSKAPLCPGHRGTQGRSQKTTVARPQSGDRRSSSLSVYSCRCFLKDPSGAVRAF